MTFARSHPHDLGRYELVARLATGGMGEIFVARVEGLAGFEKLFVVKRIVPHLADDIRFRTMLIDEARLAAKMSHPNVCQVYELGEDEGQLYIVMEYLEGITLLPLLRRSSRLSTPLDLGMIAGLIQQTAEALHYAHELRDRSGVPLNIIHRDVSPSNVFITQSGVVKVLDFGIAKVRNASAETSTGIIKGKYAYMAPEQLRAQPIDRRVDVFALGVVLYELLALRRLFQRQTDYLTFRAVLDRPIPELAPYRPDAPRRLIDAVMKAMHRDPTQRFATARELSTAVVDAISPRHRVWTQSEIGDYIHTHYDDEIDKLSKAVQAALVAREQEKPPPPMPVFGDARSAADGADEAFSAVDVAPDDASSDTTDIVDVAPAPFDTPPVDDIETPPSPGALAASRKQPEPATPIPVAVAKPRNTGPIARPAVPKLEPKHREPDTQPRARSTSKSIPPPLHPEAPRRGRVLAGLLALALIGGGGVAVWWFVLRPPEGTTTTPVANQTTKALPATGSASAAAFDAPHPSGTTTVVLDAPPAIKKVHLSIASKPTHAHVIVDGDKLGTTPLELDVPSRAHASLEVSSDGFAASRRDIELDNDLTLQVLLDRKVTATVRPRQYIPKRPDAGSGSAEEQIRDHR